jgi:transcription-repair coupling factor (superfamily II helicase)
MTLPELLAEFLRTPSLIELAPNLGPHAKAQALAAHLIGSQRAFYLAALAQATDRGLVVVCADREEALYTTNDLDALLPHRKVALFPASGKKPYQIEQIDNANVLQRAEVLNLVNGNLPNALAIVTYPEALYERVVNRKTLVKNTLSISKGDELGMEFVSQMLDEYGFEQTTFVHQPGQFACRGGILDVFSFSNDYPYRLEFLGDTIESIRSFDPVDQLSVAHLDHIAIVPNIRTHFMEDEHVTFLDFLPPSMLVAIPSVRAAAQELDDYFERAQLHYQRLQSETAEQTNRHRPEKLFADGKTLRDNLKPYIVWEYGPKPTLKNPIPLPIKGIPQPSFRKDFKLLGHHLHELNQEGYRVFVCCENDKQVRRMQEILTHEAPPGTQYALVQGSLWRGFEDPTCRLAVYTDHEIYERYHRFRAKASFERGKALTLKELTELKPGDFVTHVQHGVARFGGLEVIEQGEVLSEVVKLFYDGGDVVYVNTNALHKVAKFGSRDAAEPKLSKLGSGEWEKKKAKVKKRVKELAFDLVELYAQRKSTPGHAFAPDTYLQEELEASFLYEDTPDQETATEAVKADMEAPHPMDRLVCGDVGFGKTEIAIRAAFKAIVDGKQVALLCPTTVLAFQHWKTFSERFARFGAKVEVLNRFRTQKEQKQILKDLEAGKLDMVVGTHRLLGKDVVFKNLGLLVIDEEHKFGVAAKEKLRTKKVNVDTLTLTATPIPRTLQGALMGVRDMSVITTPPPNRQPVETTLHSFESEILRDAIAYELKRNGQVFFIHHRIKDLEEIAAMIKRLVPDARIKWAHGQMDGEVVEEVLLGFMEHQFDVLVSTTIVESGLDIPNANTIIINQAHTYGLSDLHQMRGRVGRSNRKAFCHLIAPPLHVLPTDSRKRLTALLEFSDLGSGIQIALRDLDIRGAGDILGPEQSGFINDIGFELYNQILEEAIEELKAEYFSDVFESEVKPAAKQGATDCQVDTDQAVMIPHGYIPHVAERLNFYRRVSECRAEIDLQSIAREMVDRFGMLPQPVLALFDTIRLREAAKPLGFERILHKAGAVRAYFVADGKSAFFGSPTFSHILAWVKANPKGVSLKQVGDKLVLHLSGLDSLKDVLLRVRELSAYIQEQAPVLEAV